MTTQQKYTSLLKLLRNLDDVPKNDEDIMDITKVLELYQITEELAGEFFTLKDDLNEVEQIELLENLRYTMRQLILKLPRPMGDGKKFVPVDIDMGKYYIDAFEKIMAQKEFSDRDEILASFEDLFISMYVAIDNEEKYDEYKYDNFHATVIKTSPDFLHAKKEIETYTFTDPHSKRSVDFSYRPSDLIDGSAQNRRAESIILVHKVYYPGPSSLLSPVATMTVYRQITNNLHQARHYVEKPTDLSFPLNLRMHYRKVSKEDYPDKQFYTRCSYRESGQHEWMTLDSDVDGCNQGENKDGTYQCCSDHLTSFGVQILRKSLISSRIDKPEDDFGGRMVIGPLFIVLLDLYIIACVILILAIFKDKKSFQLEFTGLYSKAKGSSNKNGNSAKKEKKKSSAPPKDAKRITKAEDDSPDNKLQDLVQYEGGEGDEQEEGESYYVEGEEEEGEEMDHSPPKTTNMQMMNQQLQS